MSLLKSSRSKRSNSPEVCIGSYYIYGIFEKTCCFKTFDLTYLTYNLKDSYNTTPFKKSLTKNVFVCLFFLFV